MSGRLDTFIYYATAPIRLFGRSRKFRLALGAACIIAVCSAATLWALNRYIPADSGLPEALAILQPPHPLQPVTRASHVIAPVAVALTAIGQTLDAAAPREFAGKNDNPVTQLLGQAEIGLTVTRGTMSATGQPNTLTIITPLNGTVRITGQIGNTAGKAVGGIGGAIGNLIGGNAVGKQIEDLAVKTLDQRTDFRGNVVVTSRPQLTPSWRMEPNLTGRLDLGDAGTNIAGVKINLGSEQVGARSDRQQPDHGAAIAAAQRSDDRAQRARAMGQDVPLDPARWRQYRAAAAMAGDAPCPRRRRAAAGRCPQCHDHHWLAGRNAHLAERDQTKLSVPGAA